ncbi:hypothetical protein BGZ61DRAFT_478888 [Ilyonectria robusta]|uniref:uncharacterized protein n=1 Tax=Ilyonectria robusta TaxID=1079257 RepID=UPI001E8E546E|nr:uncharacterized protein BGZ61DRAFT_478888 [Ilyonectria robusta]KAH8688568.1 hypothetical protein BGZ61DRAFT_478888 [Ilyonectria robusta]
MLGQFHDLRQLTQRVATSPGTATLPGASRSHRCPELEVHPQPALRQGADLEAVDEVGETPIFKATENNQLDSIKVFIEAGCCLDVVNASGTHLLSSVALHALPRVMEVLVPEIVRRLSSDTERRVKTKAWALLNGERDRTCYGSRQSIEEERNIFASLLRLDSDSMLHSPYQDSNKDDGSIYESASEYQ